MKPRFLDGCLFAVFVMGLPLRAQELPGDVVKGLSSENFQTREESQAKLLEWSKKQPKVAAPALIDISRENEDPEVRKRTTDVLKSLAEEDYLSDGQGYIGILMQEEMLAPDADGKAMMGIRVLDVMPGTPAMKSDLRMGDMIVALDGKRWSEPGAVAVFGEAISAKKPMVEVTLSVVRGGAAAIDIKVILGKRPVPDLRMAGGDLQRMEEKAKERHFREWLEKQRPR